MRPECAQDGCDMPVGRGRKAFCGPECAKAAHDLLKRQWADRNPRRSAACDVDEVAVLRAVRGDAVPLNLRERRAAVAQLTRRGVSSRAIARQLAIAPRTVLRHRNALRQESAA